MEDESDEDSTAWQTSPSEFVQTSKARKANRPVRLSLVATASWVGTKILDESARLVPQENVIFKGPPAILLAEAIRYWDTAEESRINRYNRAFICYQARARLHHWMHVAERHVDNPNEVDFQPLAVVSQEDKVLAVAEELKKRSGNHGNGDGLADVSGDFDY